MALQHLRSGTANKRPIPTVMSAGQLAINTNEDSPGLFFKDSNGDLVKVGPVHIGTSAPNSSPDSLAATALVTGTVYQILTVGNSDFTLVGASANTVGTVFTATGTTTGTGTVSGQQGNEKGEQWLDTTGSAFDLKIYDGTAWRSQAGEFVNVTGDTMTGAFGVVAGTTSAPGAFFSGDTDTGIYSPGSNQFGISTAGTSRIVVDASGNVGIGTTPGGVRLKVEQTVGTGNIFLADFSTPTAGQNNVIRMITRNGANSGTTSVDLQKRYQSGLHINNNDTHSANYTAFKVGASERLRVESSGNVGIGTTSPSASLEVTSASSETLLLLNGAAAKNVYADIDADANRRGVIRFQSAGTSQWSVGRGDSDELAASSFHISTGSSGGNSAKFVIDSSGNVGIGTTSPAQSLEVAGNIQVGDTASSVARIDFGSASTRIQHNGDDNLPIFTNGAERMRIDSSGRVIIGSSVVQAHANMDDLQLGDGSGNRGLTISSGTSGFGTLAFGDSSDASGNDRYSGSIEYSHADNSMRFYADIGERMRIDSSGNVGIGTSSPAGKVHAQVNDSGNSPSLLYLENLGTGNDTGSTIFFRNRVGTAFTDCSIQGLGTGTNQSALVFSTEGGSGATERLRINSSGNVGMGIDNPGRPLHVKGSSNVIRTESTGTASRIEFENSGSSASDSVSLGSVNNDMQFVTSGAEKMRILSGGNVGIGTSAPIQKLHVIGTSNDTVDETTGTLRLQASGGNGLLFGTKASSPYSSYIQSAFVQDTSVSQYNLLLNPLGGNVGIGTTSPGGVLQVKAATNKSFFVQSGGTDETEIANYDINDKYRGLRFTGSPLKFHTGTAGTTTAPERMRIDSSGKLLVGTSSSFHMGRPGAIQVAGGTGAGANNAFISATRFGTTSGGGEVTLGASYGSNGNHGLVPNNHQLGQIGFVGSDGTNGRYATLIKGEVDGTSGTGVMPGRLVFMTTTSGSGANPTERMRLTSSGRLLVGYTSSNNQVAGAISAVGYAHKQGVSGAPGTSTFNFFWTGSLQAWIDTTNVGNVTLSSDYRIKKNIVTQTLPAIARVKNLRPVVFERTNYKNLSSEDGVIREGFIAHELAEVIPSAVEGEKDAENQIQSINIDALTSVLTKALQEAITEIETLKQRLSDAGIA